MLHFAINITKYQSWTEHYYASFWAKVNHWYYLAGKSKAIIADIPFDTIAWSSLEKDFGNRFQPIKSNTMKEVILEAYKLLREVFGIRISMISVYWEGNFSESATEMMRELIMSADVKLQGD